MELRTSTITLVPPMRRGSRKTQNTSYAKHSGSRMHATCPQCTIYLRSRADKCLHHAQTNIIAFSWLAELSTMPTAPAGKALSNLLTWQHAAGNHLDVGQPELAQQQEHERNAHAVLQRPGPPARMTNHVAQLQANTPSIDHPSHGHALRQRSPCCSWVGRKGFTLTRHAAQTPTRARPQAPAGTPPQTGRPRGPRRAAPA